MAVALTKPKPRVVIVSVPVIRSRAPGRWYRLPSNRSTRPAVTRARSCARNAARSEAGMDIDLSSPRKGTGEVDIAAINSSSLGNTGTPA